MKKVEIITPEHIKLEYELAGIGSRFLGILVDTLIQAGVLMIFFMVVALVVPGFKSLHDSPLIASLLLGFLLIMIFLVMFAYFVFFETVWSGKTPGKNVARIQVIRDNGEPINFMDALLRNVLRIVDFLPMYYTAGIVTLLVNRENKRLGDIVAKTIVVKLREEPLPVPLVVKNGANLPELDVSSVTSDEYQLLREYLQRRDELEPDVRNSLSEKIYGVIAGKVGARRDELTSEELIETVFAEYREKYSLFKGLSR